MTTEATGAGRPTSPSPFGERARWWGLAFAGAWLVFLVPVVVGAYHRGGARSWAGIAVLVAFAAVYLSASRTFRFYLRQDLAVNWTEVRVLVGLLLALAAAAVATLGADGLSTSPYLAVVGSMVLGTRKAPFWIVAVAAVCEGLARTTSGWQHLDGIGFSVLGAGFAIWGMLLMVQRNAELLRSRETQAQLAVEHERNRFARDLHDILGHSLTVITVKAELAGRLIDLDADRARGELADLERLSRSALADVRRAVDGYREITLPGELARAKEALLAAGIRAEVPMTVDEVDSDLRELFAWTVREGVTNVVRHSDARLCAITLERLSLSVEDDGCAVMEDAPGNGLRGLSERAGSSGAVLKVETVSPHGFRLTVSRVGAP